MSSVRHDWSADDVLEELKARAVPADFSSVCRGLAHLERAGAIRRVNLGDTRTRYEASGGHHDHVRCERCGRVAEVPGCVAEAAHHPVETATGFHITGHSLLFFGVCRRCARQRQAS